eukprot:NODE_2474_length_532_cov_123.144928_g1966_i0.p1 GENE.NODE_2474_length_532_cov_123.144928_g1966_i0~~NODE_2474_length_532_cov_123.144928_g1966_i0.p1  ORF type:complete len:143 (-),score=45.86 NODE_2474_length_532_cov_123.144928_g1966_i0:79-507(-)
MYSAVSTQSTWECIPDLKLAHMFLNRHPQNELFRLRKIGTDFEVKWTGKRDTPALRSYMKVEKKKLQPQKQLEKTARGISNKLQQQQQQKKTTLDRKALKMEKINAVKAKRRKALAVHSVNLFKLNTVGLGSDGKKKKRGSK